MTDDAVIIVRRHRWTQDQDLWILANFGRVPSRTCQRVLQRSRAAIKDRALELGLHQAPDGYWTLSPDILLAAMLKGGANRKASGATTGGA